MSTPVIPFPTMQPYPYWLPFRRRMNLQGWDWGNKITIKTRLKSLPSLTFGMLEHRWIIISPRAIAGIHSNAVRNSLFRGKGYAEGMVAVSEFDLIPGRGRVGGNGTHSTDTHSFSLMDWNINSFKVNVKKPLRPGHSEATYSPLFHPHPRKHLKVQ